MAATDFKDYYAVLGVGKTADNDEIKKTYRRLARKYHPDLNPGDRKAEARFKEINEAYEVLSDPAKRRKYDQFGQYWQQADRAGSSWGGGASSNAGFDNFEFGRYGSFDEFINELLGRFNTPGAGASGFDPGSRYGSSYRSSYRTSPPPNFNNFSNFNDFASGFGSAAPDGSTSSADREATLTLTWAEAFHGVQKRLNAGGEIVNVRIPPGAKPGSKIRLRGKGQYSPYTGRRGDLYLKVEIQPHEFFEFDGDNLTCEVAIAPDEAVLGAKIDVPTPDGTVTVNVPPGVKSGQSLRLRGKGWVKPGGDRSDQFVRLAIVPPKAPTEAERAAYEQARAARSYDPRDCLSRIAL